jgi:hypothetical protein
MTTAQNPISVIDHETYPQSVVVTSNLTINEGDLVYWDNVNYTATPLSSNTQVATYFMGVAGGSNQLIVFGNDPPIPAIPVYAKATIFVGTTSGDTYNHYDLVTIGADAQTVTKSGANSANAVGAVIIDPPAAARALQATPTPETIAGGTGVRIRIVLLPKHFVGAAL